MFWSFDLYEVRIRSIPYFLGRPRISSPEDSTQCHDEGVYDLSTKHKPLMVWTGQLREPPFQSDDGFGKEHVATADYRDIEPLSFSADENTTKGPNVINRNESSPSCFS